MVVTGTDESFVVGLKVGLRTPAWWWTPASTTRSRVATGWPSQSTHPATCRLHPGLFHICIFVHVNVPVYTFLQRHSLLQKPIHQLYWNDGIILHLAKKEAYYLQF